MPVLGRIAGIFAILSGLAYLASFGSASFGSLERLGEWLITAWNLAIIPTALYLGVLLARRGPLIAAGATLAGIAASILWAFWYQRPGAEPWWIGLAAVWWVGIGWLLRHERRRLGWFTLVLAGATALDFMVTAANVSMPLFALGAFKLPMSLIWSFWVGISLLRRPASSLGPAPPDDGVAPATLGR